MSLLNNSILFPLRRLILTHSRKGHSAEKLPDIFRNLWISINDFWKRRRTKDSRQKIYEYQGISRKVSATPRGILCADNHLRITHTSGEKLRGLTHRKRVMFFFFLILVLKMLHMNGNYLFASIQVYEPRHFIVLKPPHPEPANNNKKRINHVIFIFV